MKKRLNTILDDDGVCLNWYLAMCQRFNKPYDVCETWDIDWLWEKFAEIKDDMDFWATLPPLSYPSSVPDNINVKSHLTACPHKAPRVINLKNLGWLDVTEGYENRGDEFKVWVSHNKARWLQQHIEHWDVFIDDKPQTIKECRVAFKGLDKHIIRFVPDYTDFDYAALDDLIWENEELDAGRDTLGSIKHLSQLKHLGYAN